jgi:mannose-1-phosphate guanylyltransferase
MTTIILCGGSGTRLWPLSRAAMPKQFAAIVPGGSLFEGAVRRNLEFGSSFIVAANAGQGSLAAAQLDGLGVKGFRSMVEPVGRNTAPAIALACMMLPPDEVVLVAPSDHLVRGLDEYRTAVLRAADLAREGRLVTFGIVPTYAETGYGYIETDGEAVVSFREKPDAATAERYLASGRHRWNSGMFCFTVGTFLAELKEHAPAVYSACAKAYADAPAKDPLRPTIEDMAAIPSVSVDYAVMEKSTHVACVPCPPAMGWSDLGSYDALFDELSGSRNEPGTLLSGNVAIGSPEPVLVASRGNLVVSSGKRVVLVDVSDLVIVDTPDALLVARRGSTQKVKDAVDALKGIEPGLL